MNEEKPKYSTIIFSMKEAKEKLMNLKLPGDADNLMEEFGKFLSPRLNESLVPMGFVMACELTLYKLRTGVNVSTNKPIRNRLVGYPDIVYTLMRMRIGEIANSIFPEEFAKEVNNFIEVTKTKVDNK